MQPDDPYATMIPLTALGDGASIRLGAMTLDPVQAGRLREMGLCEGRCLSVLRGGERMIVGCGGCRIALHRDLAHGMLGEVLPPPEGAAPRAPEKPTPMLSRILRRFR